MTPRTDLAGPLIVDVEWWNLDAVQGVVGGRVESCRWRRWVQRVVRRLDGPADVVGRKVATRRGAKR